MEEFKVGDKVRYIGFHRPSISSKDILRIISISPCGNYLRINSGDNGICKSSFELVENFKQEYPKENKMKKCISENYDKTADALLVEEYMGDAFIDEFLTQLIISDHKEKILAEAKRREEEAKEEND